MVEFRTLITELIDRHGGSPFKAQHVLGVTDSTLIDWRAGKRLPCNMALPGLAVALGIPLSRLRAIIQSERQGRRGISIDTVQQTQTAIAGLRKGA